jgi:hypothetical protein
MRVAYESSDRLIAVDLVAPSSWRFNSCLASTFVTLPEFSYYINLRNSAILDWKAQHSIRKSWVGTGIILSLTLRCPQAWKCRLQVICFHTGEASKLILWFNRGRRGHIQVPNVHILAYLGRPLTKQRKLQFWHLFGSHVCLDWYNSITYGQLEEFQFSIRA